MGSECVDPTPVSCYCKKVRQERLCPCVLRTHVQDGGVGMARPAVSARVYIQGQARLASPDKSRNGSHLAGGRDDSLRSPRVLHLGGLCGPEPRNGVGLARESGKTPGHRRGSRLRLERRQTRSSKTGLPCVRATVFKSFALIAGGLMSLCAAVERCCSGFWHKEFWFAYI